MFNENMEGIANSKSFITDLKFLKGKIEIYPT